MHSNHSTPQPQHTRSAASGFIALWAAAALLFAVTSARAQAPEEAAAHEQARTLGAAGLEAFRAGDFATAYTTLNQAYALVAVPTVGLWSARAAVKLGRLIEASKRYREVVRAGALVGDLDIQRKAQSDAAAELAVLTTKIPTLIIQIDGAALSEVAVSVDGVRQAPESLGTARQLDPGMHSVEAWRGDEHQRSEVQLVEGQPSRAQLQFNQPAQPAPPSPVVPVLPATAQLQPAVPQASSAPNLVGAQGAPQPNAASGATSGTVGIALTILGGASLLASGVTTSMAISEKDDINGCIDDRCPLEYRDQVETHNALRTAATVTFYAGAALTGIGLVMWLTAPSSKGADKAAVALQLGPGAARVTGVF
jgi:hypothetical protein